MRSSPLALTEYFTVHLSFSAIPAFEGDKEVTLSPADVDVTTQEFTNQEDVRKRALQLSVDLREEVRERFPYEFGISLLGYFEIDEAWPSESVDVLFSSNAPALLYSAARHAIATATGTGPYRKVILPSVTFVRAREEDAPDDGNHTSSSEASKKAKPRKAARKAKKPVES